MQSKTAKGLLKEFNENKEHYKVSETGTGTQDFVRQVFDNVFGLRPVAKFLHQKDLFGNDLADNIYQQELKKGLGNETRADFLCKINGKNVVVEVEALGGMEKGIKQIKGYIEKEHTNYAIVTDGYEWKFYNNGYSDDPAGFQTLTLEQLLSDEGTAFIQNHYNTYNHYISRFENVIQKEFNLQEFHKGLIITAESLVYDFKYSGLFTQNEEASKFEIQTTYSLIIQFILLKIIQDKKSMQLIKRDEILKHLKDQNYQLLFKTILEEVKWLGNFYESYHNQQVNLIDKIIKHYSDEHNLQSFTLDTVRPFLDLYQFIFSFNFKEVKQDLFGAVYENYLKELYKEDGTKKGQVFTPPEIVDFMLDQIGYTVDFIKDKIEKNIDKAELMKAKNSCTYNIPGLSIIDPACGSGTFLYKASGRIVNAILMLRNDNKLTDIEAGILSENLIINNIIGFDIEAFPLYLAEMNILQALLFFNVGPKGEILNQISKSIKIFSTNDSIAEFNNLEQGMEDEIRKIIENHGFERNLTSKRDSSSILGLKSDLQDFNTNDFKDKIIMGIYLKELQRPIYVSQGKELIEKKSKPFREQHQKKIKIECSTTKELLDFIKSKDEGVLSIFQKNIKIKDGYIKQIGNKIDEIFSKEQSKRNKFDFVIANPPYVKGDATYEDNLFGFNIADEEYSRITTGIKKVNTNRSKLNIFGYFIYLGYFLAKDHGKISYIIPRSFINGIALHRVRIFLKKHSFIEKIFDFGKSSLFYNRGLNGNVLVATDSCIFLSNKTTEKGDTMKYIKYSGEDGLITIEDFKKNFKQEKIGYNELFSSNQEENEMNLIDYIDELKQQEACDLIYSIYPGIDHKNKYNEIKEGYPIFQMQGYYFDVSQTKKYYKIGLEFDKKNGEVDGTFRDEFDDIRKQVRNEGFQGNDALKEIRDRFFIKYDITTYTNPTQFLLLEKKYRITRSSGSYSQKRHYFCFSDSNFISSYNSFTSIGISNIKYLPELYYLFGILNSNLIENQFQTRFSGKATLTNVKLLTIPKINSENRKKIKEKLIINSEKIINFCKNGGSKVENRGDISNTQIDMNTMNEKIVEIKPEYKDIIKGISIDFGQFSKNDQLPQEIKDKIGDISLELKRLEDERDQLVIELYKQ